MTIFSRRLRVLALLIVTLCAIASPACAQDGRGAAPWLESEIETDRDSFTPATTVVDPGRTIVESSYTFADNRHTVETHSLPELVARVGVLPWLELRVGWNWEVGGAGGAFSDVEFGDEDLGTGAESDVEFGLKAQTTRQADWIPESAVLIEGFTPTYGPANDTDLTLGYVFGWTLPNGWKWDSAMRMGTGSEHDDRFSTWAPSSVVKIPLGERWNVHFEYFGLCTEDKAVDSSRHFVSSGFHLLLTENLEIGTRFGFGINGQSSRFFNNVGLGWRF